MKATAVVMFLLALVIGILPQFLDCESFGRAIELPNGKTVAMKCHWTAMAELAMATPLVAVSGMSAFSRRKETRRALYALAILLGALAILFPTVLIGVCASADMLCNSVMRPALILSGILVVAVALFSLIRSERAPEQE